MQHRMVWALLLGGAMILTGGGLVVAQDLETTEFDNGLVAVEERDIEDLHVEVLDECTDEEGFAAVADVDASADAEEDLSIDNDVDDDMILRGIALANNGIDLEFRDLTDWTLVETRDVSEDRTVDLDEGDAVAALALDLQGGADVLACVADRSADKSSTVVRTHSSDLDDEDVVAGVAFSKAVGNVEFEDLADIDASSDKSVDVSLDSDLEEEDVLTAIALDP